MSNYIIDGTNKDLKLSGDFIVSKSAFVTESMAREMHKITSASYMYQGSSNNKDEWNNNHYYIVSDNEERSICVTPLYHQTTLIRFTDKCIEIKSI